MKTILLLSKYIAIKENSEKIELSHFKEALKSVEIIDKKAKNIIEKISITNSPTKYYTQQDLEIALKAKPKHFSPEVDKIVTLLKIKGFDTNTIISRLAFKKEKTDTLETIKNIKSELLNILYEQDEAVEEIFDALIRSEYIESKNKPKAVFLFTGDVGSGKSFGAKKFADLMSVFGYEFKVFNMSNYTSDNHSFVLNGLSKGYSGAKEGELTSFVKKHPKSIILFDSIEKAHNNVINTLNEILDNGSMVDNFTNKKVDFSNTILIFETDAGKGVFLRSDFDKIFQEDKFILESMLLENISKEVVPGFKDLFVLPREFLSRISDEASIVMFKKLSFIASKEILKKQLLKEKTLLEKRFNININIEDFDTLAQMLVLSAGPDFAIRKILKKGALSVYDPITDKLLVESITDVDIKVQKSKDFEELLKENPKKLLRNLFRKNKTLSFELDEKVENNKLILTFKNLVLKTIKKVSDLGEKGLVVEIPEIRFDDIAGHNKVKDRLKEIIKILKDKELNKEYSEYISKGMLLYGPPGTGKTLLAKAFANESDLPFIATTGPDLLDEQTLKDVFAKAREYAPSILFIDEIDVFKHRGHGYATDLLINKLLTEIDGFSTNSENRIFIIAATNLKEQIDSAILRSGRIDIHIEINSLDKEARKYFIDKFLENPKFKIQNIENIIKMTAGFSGADLNKLQREVILDAFRKDIEIIDDRFLIEHINIIKYGEKLTNIKAVYDVLEQTAYHEVGHAVVSKILFPDKNIEQITISPRKNSLGFVSYEFRQDVQYDINELENMICVSLAGRISENKKFGKMGINSGASNDLEKATQLAYKIIATFGMIDNINIDVLQNINKDYFKEKVEIQIEKIISQLTKKTTQMIDDNWDKIEKLVSVVIDKETIYTDEIEKLF